jgi:hypothetical protein
VQERLEGTRVVGFDRARERLLATPDDALVAAGGDALGGERQRLRVDDRDLRRGGAGDAPRSEECRGERAVTALPCATGRSP